MPHIHTGPSQYDMTASAYVYRREGSDVKVLLHTHKKFHLLMQPGGHVELNENPWQTVLHELEEETGYQSHQLKVLQPAWAFSDLDGVTNHPIAFCINSHDFMNLNHKHTDLSFAFVTNDEPIGFPQVDNGESAELRWVTRNELAELRDDQVIANVRQIALKGFDVCVKSWQARSVTDYAA